MLVFITSSDPVCLVFVESYWVVPVGEGSDDSAGILRVIKPKLILEPTRKIEYATIVPIIKAPHPTRAICAPL